MSIGREMLNGGVSRMVLISTAPRLFCLTYYLVSLLYPECYHSNRNDYLNPTKGQRFPISFTTSGGWGCFGSGSQDDTQIVEERAQTKKPDTLLDELNTV